MPSYWQLLLLIAPVFVVIAAGAGLRRMEWLTAEADKSLLNVVVKFLYPCLIFSNILGNPALRSPANLLWPPLIGFAIIAFGILACLWAGKSLGMQVGAGRRTFAFATGINNYGYLPIPLISALYGRGALGVLLVYNAGVEAAIWTIGILVLSGLPLHRAWRQLVNPPMLALFLAVACNELGLAPHIPAVILNVAAICAQCAVPLGLLLIGATLSDLFKEKSSRLFARVTTPAACVLRLGLLPVVILLLARYLPVTPELRHVILLQGAMPAGIFPIVIAKHYGGRSDTAAQVVLATNLAGLAVMPLWLHLGMAWG